MIDDFTIRLLEIMMSDKPQSDWIEFKLGIQEPEIGQVVWYFFEHTGVSLGKYVDYNTFASKRGFLCGDVTHYIVFEDTQEKPNPPIDMVIHQYWFWKFMNSVDISYDVELDLLCIKFVKDHTDADRGFITDEPVYIMSLNNKVLSITAHKYLERVKNNQWHDEFVMKYVPSEFLRNY